MSRSRIWIGRHRAVRRVHGGATANGRTDPDRRAPALAAGTARRANAGVALMQSSGLGALIGLVIARDLRLALRHWEQVIQPLIFFAIITTLFPLAISPALDELRRIAP